MIILILRSARQFGFNNGRQKKDTIYRDELRYGFLGEISRNQNRNFVPMQRCVKFAVDSTLYYCMVLILKNIKRTEIMKTLTLKKKKLEEVKYISINTRSDAICARFFNGSNQRVQVKQFKPIPF